MWLQQASVLALAVSLVHSTPTELIWSRVESSNCGTQAVTTSITALKAGAAYPVQFCQFYTSGNRVLSPFTDISVSALKAACRCVLADASSTPSSSKASSTSTQAAAATTSLGPIKTVKSAFKDYTSFCTFYVAHPRTDSTIPSLSAAQVEKACNSILSSTSTSSLSSTSKSTSTRSSTVSASSNSKTSSKASSSSSTSYKATSPSNISKTLSKVPSTIGNSKTSSKASSGPSTSKTLSKASLTSTASGTLTKTSSLTSGSTISGIFSSASTSASALSTSTPFYLVAQNVSSSMGETVVGGSKVETLASALNGPVGFTGPQSSNGWVQHNYTIDTTTGYIYDRSLLVGAGRADGASSGPPLSIEAGNADFAPLVCAVPVGGSALSCNVTYESVVYTRFLVTCCSSPTLYIGDDSASSSYSSLDLQVNYESTPTTSTQTSSSATPAPTYYLLAQNAGDYLSGNQALAELTGDPTSQPGFNFPYFEPAGTAYYTFNSSTGHMYNNDLIMGADPSGTGTGYLPIYPGHADLTPLICITPTASSLLNCSVTHNGTVYSQFVLDGGDLLGLSERGDVPSGYSTLDLQVIPNSVPYSPGSGDQ